MYKTKYLTSLIPIAITKLFSNNTQGQSVELLSERLTTQVNSIFVKGERLYNEICEESGEGPSPLPTSVSLGSFKNRLKACLITLQSKGSSTEWAPENYRLCTQRAKRKSPRLNINQTTGHDN